MNAVHFGAGNIGRGFIGEVLFRNGFHIDFVDVNEKVISELKKRGSYEVEYASQNKERVLVDNVCGINNKTEPEDVIRAISSADLVTTAIGPNILPFIAELIAKGIQMRKANNVKSNMDVIACENMIGGTALLFSEVKKYLTEDELAYINLYIGFPNAAVDRIVPAQSHDDPLLVSVEPFKEWVIDDSLRKAKNVTLSGVEYVPDLLPFIERKLFSVNTGHATVAYSGNFYNKKTIAEAIVFDKVLNLLEDVLNETGSLLIKKWGFEKTEHEKYIKKIIGRFENPKISDDITRVARQPLRKLSFNERFIRPMRELKERGLSYKNILYATSLVFYYDCKDDNESIDLQRMLKEHTLQELVKKVTSLEDSDLVNEIAAQIKK